MGNVNIKIINGEFQKDVDSLENTKAEIKQIKQGYIQKEIESSNQSENSTEAID